MQALEAATGIPRADTRSATARRVFNGLGMRLVQLGPAGSSAGGPEPTNAELDAAIATPPAGPRFADRLAARGVTTVTMNDQGEKVARPPDRWAQMHAQPGLPVAGMDASNIPPRPGVYAIYRDGEPVYVGRAIAAGGLQRRLKTQHLKTGNDLSWSAFRRNVAEHLGIAPSTITKQRPPQLTAEQVAPVNEWVAGCELRWVACAGEDEASQLEVDLKNERKPPLTKR